MTFNGDMLRLARQRRRFSQTEAGPRLGIDQTLLSRCENGLIELRDDLVEKAASVYDVPKTFFSLRDPIYGAPVSVHPMWRKKADVSVRDLDGVVAELNVRVIHLRRMLEAAEISNTNDLPRMDIEEFGSPERIAALVRAHWRVPSGPIKSMISLVEKAGVIVADSPLGGASISGVTFNVPGLPPLIVLNSEQPSDRRRFTLAHELAHLIMHRFPTPNMEQEANEFAVAFLMPTSDMRPYFVGKKIDLAVLAALKPEWRVSMAALLMRAQKLGYLSDNQYTYLWKQISARGYRLREPPELDFELERPELLPQMISVHLSALGYSIEDLSRLLHVGTKELTELYGIGVDAGGARNKLSIVR